MLTHYLICCLIAPMLSVAQNSTAATPAAVGAVGFENELMGAPEVECGPDGFAVNINTRLPFNGQVYVKGQYSDENCRNDQHGIRTAGINLKFESCRIQRLRSLEPRGVQVSATVVITFHPKFVTTRDQAFLIKCFYMEAVRELTAQLDVSTLPTAAISTQAPMPVCRYQILHDGPTGEPVKFATVGQQVYHKWQCDTEMIDTYCMTVHSCYVDDGKGDKVFLLDEGGCARDPYLLDNLDYMTETMAGQGSLVFKYADRPQLFFQCSLDIAVKDPHQPCARPICDNPRMLLFFKRSKRSLANSATTMLNNNQPKKTTIDLAASFEAAGLTDDVIDSQGHSDDICISHFTFTTSIVTVVVLMFITAAVGTTFIFLRRR